MRSHFTKEETEAQVERHAQGPTGRKPPGIDANASTVAPESARNITLLSSLK